jgi:hypothetical protein
MLYNQLLHKIEKPYCLFVAVVVESSIDQSLDHEITPITLGVNGEKYLLGF